MADLPNQLYFLVMNINSRLQKAARVSTMAAAGIILVGLLARQSLGVAQDHTDFPEGYDAVEAAPESHRVIFENALVRVLEVTMPAPGKTEPMHHHRWPGFFLDWDTGGRSPHIRYHQPGGKVREMQSNETPTHPGRWVVQWMKPEPMHAIETLEVFPLPAISPRCVLR